MILCGYPENPELASREERRTTFLRWIWQDGQEELFVTTGD